MKAGYTVAQIRAAEAQAFARLGPDALMQAAAAGLASAILRLLRDHRRRAYGAKVLLVVGSGNNGGDALFAGAILARRGVQVRAWQCGPRWHEAGVQAFLAAGGRPADRGLAETWVQSGDLIVDAVAGIGSRPGLSEGLAAFAALCSSSAVPVVAVDLPSGVAPEPPFSTAPSFRADLTVTFGGYKLCHLLEPTRSLCGEISLVNLDLELPEPEVIGWEDDDVSAVWPVPDATGDKYRRGVVGLDTGSPAYPGAAVLSAAGALGVGAGMVRHFGPPVVGERVLNSFPNVVLGQGRVQALVLGSGWGDRKDRGVVARAVAAGVPLVVDADALGHLPPKGHPGVLLTPHAGELARLLQIDRAQVETDPLQAVGAAAGRTGCTVLLKGATQYLAEPGLGQIRLAVPGPAWAAQAGSGDVLAGACGALLAAGLSAPEAGLAAASLQAMVGGRFPGPTSPQTFADLAPGLIGAQIADKSR